MLKKETQKIAGTYYEFTSFQAPASQRCAFIRAPLRFPVHLLPLQLPKWPCDAEPFIS